MRAGILLIVLYWALFTIREGLQPKVAAEVKAATYDMKRASGLEKLEHTRRLQYWTVAKWALRVCGWTENVLLGAVMSVCVRVWKPILRRDRWAGMSISQNPRRR